MRAPVTRCVCRNETQEDEMDGQGSKQNGLCSSGVWCRHSHGVSEITSTNTNTRRLCCHSCHTEKSHGKDKKLFPNASFSTLADNI